SAGSWPELGPSSLSSGCWASGVRSSLSGAGSWAQLGRSQLGRSSASAPTSAICWVLSVLPSVCSSLFISHLALIRHLPWGYADLVTVCAQQLVEQRTVAQ